MMIVATLNNENSSANVLHSQGSLVDSERFPVTIAIQYRFRLFFSFSVMHLPTRLQHCKCKCKWNIREGRLYEICNAVVLHACSWLHLLNNIDLTTYSGCQGVAEVILIFSTICSKKKISHSHTFCKESWKKSQISSII